MVLQLGARRLNDNERLDMINRLFLLYCSVNYDLSQLKETKTTNLIQKQSGMADIIINIGESKTLMSGTSCEEK